MRKLWPSLFSAECRAREELAEVGLRLSRRGRRVGSLSAFILSLCF